MATVPAGRQCFREPGGPDFDGWVKGVLADAELPAEYLEIELTESVAFGNPAIFPALDALRAIGVRFAADDFGTGYSCLQHLKCCPITTLKIDQSFVAGLANDRRDQTIVRAVIQLAHGLGMDVICTNLDYAQYSCAPKRGEHGDGHPTDSRTRRGHSA
jgi:EAL domain-containing protein (putative c-di-GMP-specific phosphodiesterase class I)